jgi:hypothetical protein
MEIKKLRRTVNYISCVFIGYKNVFGPIAVIVANRFRLEQKSYLPLKLQFMSGFGKTTMFNSLLGNHPDVFCWASDYLIWSGFWSPEKDISRIWRLGDLSISGTAMGNSHKNLLLRNHGANCNQSLVEWSLDGPLPKLCLVIPTSNQDGHQAKIEKRGDEIKKKSSPLKLLSQSQPNFAEMILGWSPSKIVSDISDLRPRWPPQPNLI